MRYYMSRTLTASFDEAVRRVVEGLGQEGFGVLTEIDVAAVLKKKLGVDFRRYRILGACNPLLAHQALQNEDRIGLMLPCNVVVQERSGGEVEVSTIDPLAAMQPIGNPTLDKVAKEARARLQRMLDNL